MRLLWRGMLLSYLLQMWKQKSREIKYLAQAHHLASDRWLFPVQNSYFFHSKMNGKSTGKKRMDLKESP